MTTEPDFDFQGFIMLKDNLLIVFGRRVIGRQEVVCTVCWIEASVEQSRTSILSTTHHHGSPPWYHFYISDDPLRPFSGTSELLKQQVSILTRP